MVRRLLLGSIAFLLLAAALPAVMGEGGLRFLSECLLMLVMAQMWNLLAGYAGLVSMGHQAFVAIGAYAAFMTSIHLQISPYFALPAAPLVCAVVAVPIARPLFRLREAYFSIAMWVFAEILAAAANKSVWLGGSVGTPLTTSGMLNFDWFEPILFWIASAMTCVAVGGVYLLMNSRFGLGLMAVRDNDLAAQSIGVDVQHNRFIAFVISAAGCGLAGAVNYLGNLLISPLSAFDVTWVVNMIFIVIIGGIGTIEGPILGTIIFFALREFFTDILSLPGGWYLVAVGVVAVATMLWAPGGLWPLIRERFGVEPFTVRRRPPAQFTNSAEGKL
jgi:branched-chain amino acid transport system permease protein